MTSHSFLITALTFFSLTLSALANSEIDDFHMKFSIPAPTGSVETYIYSMDGSLMIEKDIERICVSGNQTTYSITRIPAEAISEIYVKEFGEDYSVFVGIHRGSIEEKKTMLVDCFGQEWPQEASSSSIILTGPDEALAARVSSRIREEFGIK